jgi:shikimate dehydrogenase
MNQHSTGATRLNIIVDDPSRQVKAPGAVTKACADIGHDGILVPVQVAPEDLSELKILRSNRT